MKMNLSKHRITNFIVAGALLGAIGCAPDPDGVTEVPKVGMINSIQNVEVVHPSKNSFVSETVVAGTAEPNRSVMLYAMEGGMVEMVHKEIGDKVKIAPDSPTYKVKKISSYGNSYHSLIIEFDRMLLTTPRSKSDGVGR